MARLRLNRTLLPLQVGWLGLSIACGSDAPATPFTEYALESRSTIGRDDPAVWFSRIVGARLHEDGRITAVDRESPFVRHYDAGGTELRRFLEQGGGPGEARYPVSLAVTGPFIAVGSRSDVVVFDTAGRYLLTHRLPQPAVDIAAGCGPNELAVYGPGAALPDSRVEWLTLYEVTDSTMTRARAVFTDTVRNAVRGYGKRRIASDVTRLAFFHEYPAEPFIVTYDCASGHVTHVPVPERASPDAAQRVPGGEVLVAGAGDAMFFGIAVIEVGVAWVLMRYAGPPAADGETRSILDLFLWDGERGTRRVHRTTTGFTLLDGRGDALLLHEFEPVPHLRIVVVAPIPQAGPR